MNTWYFIKCWQDLIDNILRYIEGSNRFNFSLIHYFCTFFLDSLRVFRTTYFYPYSMEVYIFHENNMHGYPHWFSILCTWLSTLVFISVYNILLHFESTLYHPRFFAGVRVSSLFSFLCRVCVCVCFILFCLSSYCVLCAQCCQCFWIFFVHSCFL
jgi:uncharacterized membrane protein YhdT